MRCPFYFPLLQHKDYNEQNTLFKLHIRSSIILPCKLVVVMCPTPSFDWSFLLIGIGIRMILVSPLIQGSITSSLLLFLSCLITIAMPLRHFLGWTYMYVSYCAYSFHSPLHRKRKSARLHYAFGFCTQGARWERNLSKKSTWKYSCFKLPIHIDYYYLCFQCAISNLPYVHYT